jgi:hypothetical protein
MYARHWQPAPIDIADVPVPLWILAQSPAETAMAMEIGLFRSSPENTLHDSLIGMNEKPKGLLEDVRKPDLIVNETRRGTPHNGAERRRWREKAAHHQPR